MQFITNVQFNQICLQDNLKVLKICQGTKPKVLEKEDVIIKLFYPKKSRFSSSKVKPRALRFYRNCERLLEKGYLAPKILDFQYYKDERIHLIHYQRLEGYDIRYLAARDPAIIFEVAKFIADLHANGVWFRGIHLENLLYQANGQFALIDVADLKFRARALSLYIRYRNLKHLFNTREDHAIWEKFGVENFLKEYFAASGLGKISEKVLRYLLSRKN